MHEQDVGVALFAHLERLPRAHCHGLDCVPGLSLEEWNQHVEQSRVLRGGGRRQNQSRVGRSRLGRGGRAGGRSE